MITAIVISLTNKYYKDDSIYGCVTFILAFMLDVGILHAIFSI